MRYSPPIAPLAVLSFFPVLIAPAPPAFPPPFPPPEPPAPFDRLRDLSPYYSGSFCGVLAALGEEAFAAAWAAGEALPLEEAIAAALALPTAPLPGSPSTAHDRLTAREREVLGLLAAGQTNRGIAEALVLSRRTVDRHLANIYAKIGARGRAEAAAYAVRQHLIPSP